MPITSDDVVSALTSAGIDTPQKLGVFLNLAALNQANIIKTFELQKLTADRTVANSTAQAAIDAKSAEAKAAHDALLAAVSQLS